MNPKAFRVLVVASVLIGLLGEFFDMIVPFALPESLSAAADTHFEEKPLYSLIALGIGALVMMGVSAAAVVGLLLFKSWAPRLAIISVIGTLIIALLVGPGASSGWSSALLDLSSMLWGAVLAIAYFSPLKEKFQGAPR